MQKKIPLRKCNGCQEMKDKRELIRIVRSDDSDEFFIDRTGKKNGRGAYICPHADCLKLAMKHKGLERSFKRKLPAGIYESLRAEIEARDG